MKNLLCVLAVLVAGLVCCFASPAMADPPEPPAYQQHSFVGMTFAEVDVLLLEVDNRFYGKVNYYGYERTYKLYMTFSLANADTMEFFKTHVGEVVRVNAAEMVDFIRTGTGTLSEHAMIVTEAKPVPEEE